MGEGTSSPDQGEIVFPGAKTLREKAREIDVASLGSHEVKSEDDYRELKKYLASLSRDYYDGLKKTADKMDGRTRRRIPLLQKPGAQEAKWEDRLSNAADSSDSFDFSSQLLYDKPSMLDEPTLHYYLVGVDRTHFKQAKGVHPQGLITATLTEGAVQKLLVEKRSYHVNHYDWDRISAMRSGIPGPSHGGNNTEFGRFSSMTFGHWDNNHSVELVFPGQGIEPEIILNHKGGNGRRALTSSYKFSSKDYEGNPEIAFRGTVSPKYRKVLDTPSHAGWTDQTLSLPQVKEIFKGAMALMPGQIKK